MIEIEKINEVKLKIYCSKSQARELRDYLSCYIPNRWFYPKVRAGIWSGKIYFFDARTYTLPTGLLPNFHSFCIEKGYDYKFRFDKSELFENIKKEDIEKFSAKLLEKAYTSEGEKIDLRDYQLEAIHKSIRNKRGVLESATASGKSLILYVFVRLLLAHNPDRKFILVVPTINLVSQMYSDFKSYGWEDLDQYVTRMCTGYKPDFDKSILITTWQSIYKKRQSFFEKFNVLLIDECHLAKSYSIKSISEKCINADFRIGTTGTLPTEESDRYNIFGYLGNLIYRVMYNKLIDDGILSKIKIVNLILKYPEKMVIKNKNRGYPEEKETVHTYAKRNDIIRMIFDNMNDGDNTLILCENIKHLEDIHEYLNDMLPEKYLIENIHGKIKAKEREIIRLAMEKEKNMVLIGSYGTMSTGVNIKKIHNIIFASSYKSKIKVLQSIGRGLRTHKSKKTLILYDLIDDLTWVKRTGRLGCNHIYKHYLDRIKYYKEQRFKCYTKEINL
jgi:superfamily II DNA or RNA helicase